MRKSQYFAVHKDSFIYDNDLVDYHYAKKDKWNQLLDGSLKTLVMNNSNVNNNNNNNSIDWDLVAQQLTNINKNNQVINNMKAIVEDQPEISPRECFLRYNNVLAPSISRNLWTKSEEESLKQLVLKYEEHNWIAIAEELGTQRTPIECLRHYQRHLNVQQLHKNEDWSEQEDQQLLTLIDVYGIGNWQNIAARLPGRTAKQCQNRFKRPAINQADVVISEWNLDDERNLILAAMAYDISLSGETKANPQEIEEFLNNIRENNQNVTIESSARNRVEIGYDQNSKWGKVSKLVPGKNDVQCREKWYGYLDISLSTSPFSEDEDQRLLLIVPYLKEGNWAKICYYFPGRCSDQVRVRWQQLRGYSKTPAKRGPKRASNGNTTTSSRKRKNDADNDELNNGTNLDDTTAPKSKRGRKKGSTNTNNEPS